MLLRAVVATALVASRGALAHFALTAPEWRADTLSDAGEEKYSQRTYPCAGVDYGAGNVTDWPLDGGSLKLEMHHEQSYVFVNLGLGRNTSNFNVSLTPQFWNATGKGTLCVEKLPVPPGIENGTLASLQVVTAGAGGAALYNCADVRFVQGAKARGGCSDSQVRYVPVGQQKEGACPAGQGSGSPAGQRSGSGSARLAFDTLALAALVALAPLFVTGTGFL